MAGHRKRVRDLARITLAAIRLINGGLALLVPQWLVRRLGADPATTPAALYAFRMFGVRTVVLGLQLLLPDGPVRASAVRTAPVIHASDTVAAGLGAIRGVFPRRVSRTIVLISALNTVLALIARFG
jgi:hypothetical protein